MTLRLVQLLYPLEVRSTSEAEETQDKENKIVEPVERKTNQVKGIKKSSRHYKRPSGTRWVAHQTDDLKAFFYNVDLLLGYLNNQVTDPYNTTMKKDSSLRMCPSLVL